MAWTTPRTWVTAEVVTASLMNAHVRDNEQFLYDNRRELISEQIGTGSSGTLSFASIPNTFRSLELIWHLRSTAATDVTTLSARFNGDSSNLYFYNLVGDSAGKAFTTTFLLGEAPGNNHTAGTHGNGQMLIPGYATSSHQGATWSNATRRAQAGNSSDASFTAGGGLWIAATTPVSQIDLIVGSGSWSTGSKAQLYGIS